MKVRGAIGVIYKRQYWDIFMDPKGRGVRALVLGYERKNFGTLFWPLGTPVRAPGEPLNQASESVRSALYVGLRGGL